MEMDRVQPQQGGREPRDRTTLRSEQREGVARVGGREGGATCGVAQWLPVVLVATSFLATSQRTLAQDQPPSGTTLPSATRIATQPEPWPNQDSPVAHERGGLFGSLPEWLQLRGQATFILQGVPGFPARYDAPSPSLPSRRQAELSHSYTLFLGARPLPFLEGFVDPEMVRGDGINHGSGLAGAPNGDVIRNPSVGKDPYLARYFARGTIPLSDEREAVESDDHVFRGPRPVERLTFTFGKMGSNDFFDTNGYANSTRTQFMNWGFINSTAYDYAADTRGYSVGLVAELNTKDWAIRLGSFEMPTVANGIDLAGNIRDSRGDQVELEMRPRWRGSDQRPTVIKLLAFRNLSNAGRYRDAIELAQASATTPDITSVRRTGTAKYGFAVNIEQPLADDGDTGLFARAAWNNGTTETFAFTEADRSYSLGVQISGKNWSRPDDRLGIAFGQNFLSGDHRDYLQAGGVGFQVGDGRLSSGPETIVEAYYSARLTGFTEATVGYQFIANPGYNRDRGPVSVISFRVHLFF